MYTLLQSRARIAARAAALVSLFAIAISELAIAACGPESDSDRVSASISISDLDLTTPQGTQAARDRIRQQALRLCRKFSDSRRISDRETAADCTRQAVQEALTHIPTTRRQPRPRDGR